ncbi:glutamine amidotransferase [Sphingomonas sp. ASY06-1R]|uniref:glutamine amidotransferase n=1 Tax=Sphingomonas sp. ASY06-1R TaxID=3445771 RepID=UPI003FA1FC54
MLKTVVAIRHLGFEDLGFFEAPLREAGYTVHYYNAGEDELWTLDPVRTPLLIVLGGPMAVYEGASHPYLTEELRLLRTRLTAGRPTLGVCLGAQLIAAALGAAVYPGTGKEIGFGPVILSEAGSRSPLRSIGTEQPVLHWHGDTFDLPEGATLLASTAAYPHQAFAVGPNILALQFHLEAGGAMESWLTGHADELRTAGIDPERIRRDAAQYGPGLGRVAEEVLTVWLQSLRE